MSEPAKRVQRDAGFIRVHYFQGVAAMGHPSLSNQRRVSAERLRQLLHYDLDTGIFTWIARNSVKSQARIGAVAGMVRRNRRQIGIDRHQYFASRLAVLYVTGEWPKFDVDHIDTNSRNDAWVNLRDVEPSINEHNKIKANKTNKFGMRGVYFSDGRFRSCIKVNGRKMYFGGFDTPEEAHSAYIEAKRKHHPGCTI